jgi:Nucleotide-diphospho-sugar transferase
MNRGLLLFCFFFNLCVPEIWCQNAVEQCRRVPLYVIYTESHKPLFDEWFLPSIRDDFEIIVLKVPQECPTARFREKGWINTTTKKVAMIVRAVEETMGSWFVYSDVDVQFFAPVVDELFEYLRDADFVIQQDQPSGAVCSGFFAVKSNERTLNLWKKVLEYMLIHDDVSDQAALDYVLHHMNANWAVKWKLLPITYFGPGTLGLKYWLPSHCLNVPENAKMHHANWTVGIVHKQKQLAYVWKVMRDRHPSTASTSPLHSIAPQRKVLVREYQEQSENT